MTDLSQTAQAVLKAITNSPYEPLDDKGLARKLKLTGRKQIQLADALKQLELHGKIARVKRNRWVLAADAGLVAGVVQFHEKGHAYLIPEEGDEDFYIPAEDTGTALHQDTVVIRVSPERNRRGRLEGRVIRILKRRRDRLVGTLGKTGLFHIVIPDDPRFLHDIYVPAPGAKAPDGSTCPQAEEGDKVVAQLLDWTNRHTAPEGFIVERLGKAGDPGVDILSIIHKHGLPGEFPSKALAEVATLDPHSTSRPGPDRTDLRGLFTITIDPDTARDFDDAISIRDLGGGKVEVAVHIADVAYFVPSGSELDREALRRGNSTYLVNQVIPMLPEELSNGLCSLLPGVDRFTRTMFATLNAKGDILQSRVERTVIHSDKRLTYGEALERLRRKPKDDLDKFLHKAWKIAETLRKRRLREGSLEMDFPEVKVLLDEHGVPVSLSREESDESHQLIEEFMLMANEVVALTLKNKNIPTLYRVHPDPDSQKLEEFANMLDMRGLKPGDLTKRRNLQKALKAIRQRPDAHALKIGFLKSLKRASYLPKPEGHFGLAKLNYTHFTSPIRRYADLVVHRCLDQKTQRLPVSELTRIATHLSGTERTSSDAENESTRLKILEYFQAQMNADTPQTFEAFISEITNFGFFVELPEYAVSGLVHLSSITGDFFTFDPKRLTLRSRRSRKTFKSGDFVRVQVSRIDLFKRQIDFRLA